MVEFGRTLLNHRFRKVAPTVYCHNSNAIGSVVLQVIKVILKCLTQAMSHTIDLSVGHILEFISCQFALSNVESIEGCSLILVFSDAPLRIDVYEVRLERKGSYLLWGNLCV